MVPLRFLCAMEKAQLIDMVARTRISVEESQRLITTQMEKIRLLRAAGDRTGDAEAALSQLEGEYDRHLAEMRRLLDELERLPSTSPL